MEEQCDVTNCEYNANGKCLNCDDLHNPEKHKECVSFIDEDE